MHKVQTPLCAEDLAGPHCLSVFCTVLPSILEGTQCKFDSVKKQFSIRLAADVWQIPGAP